MFRGREMAHPEIARAHLDRMIEVMGEQAVVEQVARMEGRNMFVILAPSREVLKASGDPEGAEAKRTRQSKECPARSCRKRKHGRGCGY